MGVRVMRWDNFTLGTRGFIKSLASLRSAQASVLHFFLYQILIYEVTGLS